MTEQRLLDGRIVAITGASRGLGAALARGLALAGARIVLLARPSEALERTHAAIEGATAIGCDLTEPSSIAAAFAQVEQEHRRLDALINCAAYMTPSRIVDLKNDHVLREIATNLTGPILCARHAIPLLRRQAGGTIINISSDSVAFDMPFLTLYATAKAGLERFSSALREEVRDDGIRVTCLRSGSVRGGELHRDWPSDLEGEFLAAIDASGAARRSGSAIDPSIVVDAVHDLLALPPEAAVDTLVLRPI